MKKILFFAVLLACTVFTACEKEEIGGTATESMAGQWYVTVDAVDESGNPIEGGEDYFGIGKVLFFTYNTSANSENEMWIDDHGEFDLASAYSYGAYPSYSIKSKVTVNQDALTFYASNAENNADENSYGSELYNVDVEGKILKGAGTQNNGSKADSIVIFVSYKNDPWYPDDGYAKYKISGIRYSGLVEND